MGNYFICYELPICIGYYRSRKLLQIEVKHRVTFLTIAGSTKSNQSDAYVGNNPIDEHLYNANATVARLPMTYTSF